MVEPVRESVKQVDPSRWLIGSLMLRRSSFASDTVTWKDDGDNSNYTLMDAPTPRPPTTPLPPNDPYIVLVYDAGDSSAVWSIGHNAFCKVKLIVRGTTPEVATLEFLHSQRTRGFEVPKILHYVECGDRYYLFISKIPGRTLMQAWPNLNAYWREYYVKAIMEICKNLADWKGHMLAGVDGKSVPEQYLIKDGAAKDYSPMNLQKACEEIGMDCSNFVFYHADLGPGNIIVENDPKSGAIGIIDWETAGYFPRGWVRTKFRISSGMNLGADVTEPTSWRSKVQKLLGDQGFEDYSNAWQLWWY
ncbi:hypothetical protein RJZ56_005082 [Blastomyces dermatitidis]